MLDLNDNGNSHPATLRPGDFPLGSPESRAAVRALLDSRKNPKATAEERERQKCAEDAEYFIWTYCRTRDEHDPDIEAKPFPEKIHLRLMVRHWLANRMSIFIKSRQIMATHLMSALHLWLALFKNNQRIFYSSKKEADAADLVERSYRVYEHLPPFLKCHVEYSFCHLKFFRAPSDKLPYSEIIGTPSGPDVLRQFVSSAILADEFGFQVDQEGTLGAAQPTILGGGRIALVSSAEPGLLEELIEDLPEMPCEQIAKGITRWTTSLSYSVMRVHFSSDPAKDPDTSEGKQWLEEAQKGLSAARFRKEYEIDFGALSGQLVFPEFRADLHLCKPFELDPDSWSWWMACDPHPRTPHGFVWLAVNAEGDLVIPFSWQPEKQLIVREYAEGIRHVEKKFLDGRPIRRLMDPAGAAMNAEETKSYFDSYREAKIVFHPAKKNRDYSGFDLIREALIPYKVIIGNTEETRARLRIFEGNGWNQEVAWQLGHLRYREWHGNITDKDAPEAPEEKRKHFVDCVSYILLARPRKVVRKPEQQAEVIYESCAY